MAIIDKRSRIMWLAAAIVVALGAAFLLSQPGTHSAGNPNATFDASVLACNSSGLFVNLVGTGAEVLFLNSSIKNVTNVTGITLSTDIFRPSDSVTAGHNSTAYFADSNTSFSPCGAYGRPFSLRQFCVSYQAPTINATEIYTACGLLTGFST